LVAAGVAAGIGVVAGAAGADPIGVPRLPACNGVAHSEQNLAPAGLTVPHVGQPGANGDPHSVQNFASARFPVPQFEQITRVPSRLRGRRQHIGRPSVSRSSGGNAPFA
jgi:hypothetical protein